MKQSCSVLFANHLTNGKKQKKYNYRQALKIIKYEFYYSDKLTDIPADTTKRLGSDTQIRSYIA
jgi:hypothetical protein